MFEFLLVLLTVVAGTVIPTLHDLSGMVYLEARVGVSNVIPHRVSLGSRGQTFLHSMASYDFSNQDLIIRASMPSGNISVTTSRHEISVADDIGWIAIGPGSDFVSQFGSVDIVGNELILGSTRDSFYTEHCSENSTTEIFTRFGTLPGYSVRVYSTVSVNVGTVQTTASLIFEPIEHVLHGPAELFESMFSMIPSLDQSSSQRRLFFGSCSRVSKLLPSIRLMHFGDSGDSEQIITPHEYIRRVSRTSDVCELLVSRDWTMDNKSVLLFNPLRIQGVRIRSTADQIVVCKSQISR